MPHATYGYTFEWKVFDFAGKFASRLAGKGFHRFLMVFNDRGSVQTVQFESPKEDWHQTMEKLEQAGSAFLLYDPFDAPEYTYLRWCRIERPTMERLLGEPFADGDFTKGRYAASAPNLEPATTYPATWAVMF